MEKDPPRGGPDAMLAETRRLMRRHGLRARKGLGQHFLTDSGVLDTILAAADLSPADTVIEVGPGLGIMTRELAARAGAVIAIELDNQLAAALQETMAPYENCVIVNQDVLGTDPLALLKGRPPHVPPELQSYKVVANLPYYITAPVLRHFLEASLKPRVMVVMVQREVAEVITAAPGQRTLLSNSVQFYGSPRIVAAVPAAAFYPAPEVDSAVVRIDVYDKPPVDVDDVAGFFRLVRAGFRAARKQAANSLAAGLGRPKEDVLALLAQAGIDPKRRAETFTLEEWARLLRSLKGRND